MQLRDYQQDLIDRTLNALGKNLNPLVVLPTGGGKTVVMSNTVKNYDTPTVAIAHRQELVGQISKAVARNNINHSIIGPKSVSTLCAKRNLQELKRTWITPNAKVSVAGVDTFVRRNFQSSWADRNGLWVLDEAHHGLVKNKWGKAVSMLPNALGAGYTATPLRADGNGLGKHTGGLFDVIIQGPSMRQLIEWGYLSEFRIFAPPCDLNLGGLKVGPSGEFTKDSVSKVLKGSTIVGDVVDHYLKFAPGKKGITFAPDVETSKKIVDNFNSRGIPAVHLDGSTPTTERERAIADLDSGAVLMVSNVALFDEGFDAPSIEVVIMASMTNSYGRFMQQIGRALRVSPGKEYAVIIDAVFNVLRHGLPDSPKTFTLDSREKRTKKQEPPGVGVKTCTNPGCAAAYSVMHKVCPFCEVKPEPVSRTGPEFVDGDLVELTSDTLAALRAKITEANKPTEQYRMDLINKNSPDIGVLANVKRRKLRLEQLEKMKTQINMWADKLRQEGREDHHIHKEFYALTGTDVLTAQSLPTKELSLIADRLQ